jgi:hypothetical protein
MIESQYTQAVHKKLPPDVYKWKINDNYASGVADAFYRRNDGKRGAPLWVEYKYIKALPKRDSTVIIPDLSAKQVKWLKEANAAGEQSYVIVGCGSKGVIYSLEELNGLDKKTFEQRLMTYQQIADWIENRVKD